MGRGQNETLLSAAEAARILHVAPETLRRWEDKKKIPSSKTKGGHRRYQLNDILQLQNIIQGQEEPHKISLFRATVIVSYDFANQEVKIAKKEIKEEKIDSQEKAPRRQKRLQELSEKGYASPSFAPQLQTMPNSNENFSLTIWDQRIYRNKTEANDWLEASIIKYGKVLRQAKPIKGVIGISNIDSLLTEGSIAEHEDVTPKKMSY